MAAPPSAASQPFTVSEYESSTARPSLLPLPLGGAWSNNREALQEINKLVKPLGYAIVIADSQKSPAEVKNKLVLRCSKGRKSQNTKPTKTRPGAESKRVDCPFKAIARLNEDAKWTITEMLDPEHNHAGDLEGAISRHRQYAMTDDVKKSIRAQLTGNSTSSEILSFIQSKYDHDPNNPILGAKDIFNYLATLRNERLGNMTPIQALNVSLHNDPDWFVKVQLDSVTQQVQYLFFCNKASKEMLLHNGETLILDCTYKTNLYSMPLVIGTGVTDLNISFYAAMCFLKGEKLEDYCFLIRAYKELYQELDIPLPEVWFSDGELNIPVAIAQEIGDSAVHILCCWHLEQNVLTNCYKHFRGRTDSNELWIQFFGDKKAKPAV